MLPIVAAPKYRGEAEAAGPDERPFIGGAENEKEPPDCRPAAGYLERSLRPIGAAQPKRGGWPARAGRFRPFTVRDEWSGLTILCFLRASVRRLTGATSRRGSREFSNAPISRSIAYTTCATQQLRCWRSRVSTRRSFRMCSGWIKLSMVDRHTHFVDEIRKQAAEQMDAILNPVAVKQAQAKPINLHIVESAGERGRNGTYNLAIRRQCMGVEGPHSPQKPSFPLQTGAMKTRRRTTPNG